VDILFIILGLLFIIASMVFFLNPPEAWVKKAFGRGGKSAPIPTPIKDQPKPPPPPKDKS
jgi:hypothetical protein